MKGTPTKIFTYLYPISWLYGWAIALRNKLFDWGYLRSKSFDIPVICIGNLAVGGTGKTPHTEYLIELLLKEKLNIATLSRGYKRSTKGYVLATEQSNAAQIGDEPYQMKSKFPSIQTAVDENRCHAIEQLLQLKNPPVDVVLLDDGFQHRYVKAGLNILLTDYHRLFSDDALLPAGRLREPASSKSRAQIVIVTKCPQEIKPIDFNIIGKRLQLYPYQQLYFSAFEYGNLQPLFPEEVQQASAFTTIASHNEVLLVTGIASPEPLIKKIKAHTPHVTILSFDDHHHFSDKDMLHIKAQFLLLKEQKRLIVTTEKDASRLKHHPALEEELKPFIYVLPIKIEMLHHQKNIFNQKIIDYVRKNSRNSYIPKK